MSPGSSCCLSFRNRQRTHSIDLRLLRQITLALLRDVLAIESFELGVHLVGPVEMTRLNETFLHHAGSTDVITFNYLSSRKREILLGDIFICVSEAVLQARRFRTAWQTELVRYLVHGILHLQGYDDLQPVARRKMKREEDRLVRTLARHFPLHRLPKGAKRAAGC